MKAIFFRLKASGFPGPKPSLVEDVGNFTVAVMIKEAIDLANKVRLELADLSDGQGAIEHRVRVPPPDRRTWAVIVSP